MIKYMRYVGQARSGGMELRPGALYVAVGFDAKSGQWIVKDTHAPDGQTRRVLARDVSEWIPQRGERVEYFGTEVFDALDGQVSPGAVMTLMEEIDVAPGAWLTETAAIVPTGENWRPMLGCLPLPEDDLRGRPKARLKSKNSTARWDEI